MIRLNLAVAATVALLPMLGARDQPPLLPPLPAPGPTNGTAWLVDALFMQANMIEGGEVMFLVSIGEPDPKKPSPPAVFARVDGKAVRAFDTDRKPLDIPELNKRLSLRAAVMVVHGQPPDPFFLKVLNERSVVFVVTKKLFDRMATAVVEPLQGLWTVMKTGKEGDIPTADYWIIQGEKIAVHRGGKLDGYMSYKFDATDYPKTIDLIPDRGPAKGKTLQGIYELDGNTLKICFVAPTAKEPATAQRPEEIGAKGTVTRIFGRIPP